MMTYQTTTSIQLAKASARCGLVSARRGVVAAAHRYVSLARLWGVD